MTEGEIASSSEENIPTDDDSGSSESNEEDYQIVKPTKINPILREQTELQVSPKADEAMIEALNEVARIMATEAIKVAERKSGGSTVQSSHVATAYDQIQKPHNSLYRAINKLDEARDQVKAAAESSPFSDRNINE